MLAYSPKVAPRSQLGCGAAGLRTFSACLRTRVCSDDSRQVPMSYPGSTWRCPLHPPPELLTAHPDLTGAQGLTLGLQVATGPEKEKREQGRLQRGQQETAGTTLRPLQSSCSSCVERGCWSPPPALRLPLSRNT